MIRTSLLVPDNDYRIDNQVALSVIDDIMTYLKIPSDVPFINDDGNLPFKNEKWNVGDIEKSIEGKLSDINIFYSITPNINEEQGYMSRSPYNIRKPVIYDPETKTRVTPNYLETIMTIDIKILSKSKNRLVQINNMLRYLQINAEDLSKHSVLYSYHLPEEIIELLLTIYDIRYEATGENIDPITYFKNIGDDRLNISSNVAGDVESFNILFKEIQGGVNGIFESDLVNDTIEYNDNYYVLDFTYKIIYDRPTKFDIQYNQIVYNRLLPEEYIKFVTTNTEPDEIILSGDQVNLSYFEEDPNNYDILSRLRERDSYIRIPSFDIHDNLVIDDVFTPIFSVLTTITDDDKRTLFNISDIPDYNVDQKIVDLIIDVIKNDVFIKLKSMFYIALFNYDKEIINMLEIDDDGNIYSKEDLDMKGLYRVLFCIVPDLTLIDKKYLDLLLKHPDLINKWLEIIKYVDPNIEVQPGVINSKPLLTRFMKNVSVKFNYQNRYRVDKFFSSSIIAKVLTVREGE